MTESGQHRFYGELAEWWPLISPTEEYEEEAGYAAGLLGSAAIPVHEVLELGSGGGHNAVHLKAHFTMTLVDLSEQMLAVSRRLNPECEHRQGDMRTVRLGRSFDAVFLHDAVDYMTTDDDLRATAETAFTHCRAGGIAVFLPNATAEIFDPSSDSGGSDGEDGRGVRFLDWSWDPDPDDGTHRVEYAFLLRSTDGHIRVVHETHLLGLFSRATWLRTLTEAGFEAERIVEETTEPRTPRDVFIGRRPSSPAAGPMG
jgi:SAM-dependent methyltransferase